jgi:HEAT repeat protein
MNPAALALILAVQAPGQTLPLSADAAPAIDVAAEEQVLQAAGLPAGATDLLAFFRRRVPPGPDKARLAALVLQLSDKTPAVRQQAAAELIGLGHAAIPALRPAANNPDDEESAGRARRCLEAIEGPGAANLTQAAARLVAARNPPGAAAVLLAYLPFADNDAVLGEVEGALVACRQADKGAAAVVVQALHDPVPVRRCAAARVLCLAGSTTDRAAVGSLLKDPQPSVRLVAALGLAEAHTAEAVPVLIDMLAALPPEGRKQAEEYLTTLAGEWAVAGPAGNDSTSARLRRETWAAWWRSLDGNTLLEEFRSRTLSDAERARVLGLIAKLDDPSAEAREKAAADLVACGARAAPLLRQAVGQNHPRIGPQAAHCLAAVEPEGPRPLPAAAPRLLALRRPEGTVEALLAYLPFADSDEVAGQVIDLLADLGCRDGKAAPALVQALTDPVPARRAAAAVALCRGRAEAQLPAVRRVLRDGDAGVRLRAALALAARGEREAVPVVIALLGELPLEQAWEAEDYLLRAAGERAPAVSLEGEAGGRTAAVEAWRRWWNEHGSAIDLARVDARPRSSGLFLVVEQQGPRGTGRALEVSAGGTVRWQIGGLQFPWDAQVLPGGNVLVVEQGIRLTERDRDGKAVWQHAVPNAISARRLRNGQTFVVCRNQLLVLDREGKQVFAHLHSTGFILAGERFRDGQMAFVTYQGQYVRLDAAGKQMKTFQVPFIPNFGVNGALVLPGDRVLVSLSNPGKVIEYAPGGKVAWEAAVTNPGNPTRLPNGHTLVPSNGNTTLTELDRNGRIVSEKKDLPHRPFRIYPR